MMTTLDALDELVAFVSGRLAKAETLPARVARDELQRKRLQYFVDDLRDYFAGFAARAGIPLDAESALAKRGFVGFPTKPPFDLKVDWDDEHDILASVMSRRYLEWAKAGTGQAAADLAAANADVDAVRGIAGALDLGDYDFTIRQQLANRIVQVNDTTKAIVRQKIEVGVQNGYGIKQIVNGTPDGKYKGLVGVVEQTYRNRSRVIALTESANAYNLGQLEGYKRSGIVEKVRIFDGSDCGWLNHDDPDKANGTERTIADATAHPTSHPNCQRAWAPVPLTQTSGIGRGTTPDKPVAPKPSLPKPSLPRTPTPEAPPAPKPTGAGRFTDVPFEQIEQHILPDGHTWDDLAGVIRGPDGFAKLPKVDTAMQRRITEVMQERYGISEVNWTPKAKQLYSPEDMRSLLRGFEDYREIGVQFDDLQFTFSGKASGNTWAHFDNIEGIAGEVQVNPTLTRSVQQARSSGVDSNITSGFHGTETSYRATLRHELGHAMDSRTMGGSTVSRGARFSRAGTDREFADAWQAIHNSSSTPTTGPQLVSRLDATRLNLKRLDDSLALYRGQLDDVSNPQWLRDQARNNLAATERQRYLVQKQLDILEDIRLTGRAEKLPTRYAAKSAAEDFAESVDMYLDNPASFKRLYPRRAAHVEEALERMRKLPRNYADELPNPSATVQYQEQQAAKKLRAIERRKATAERRAEAKRRAAEIEARLAAERKAAEEAARREAERRAAEEAARLEAERRAAEEAARRAGYRPLEANGPLDPRFAEKSLTDIAHEIEVQRRLAGHARFEDGDTLMGAMNRVLGADGKPLIVTDAELDDLIAQGWRQTWRGVTDKRYTQAFREGDFYPGYGIYGNGTYSALGETSGAQLAYRYSDKTANVMRMALRPDAKVIDYQSIVAQQGAERRALQAIRNTAREASDEWFAAQHAIDITDDLGRYALSKGYDAIEVGRDIVGDVDGYLVVLNRTAVAVSKTTGIDTTRWPGAINNG